MERTYFIVRKHVERGSYPYTDLRVLLDDIEEKESQIKAERLLEVKLREKYPPPDYFVQTIYHKDLVDFCREHPVAAAKYIEDKLSTEVFVSELLNMNLFAKK